MSRLNKLLGKSKEYMIGDEKLVISPLSMENIELVMDLSKPEKATGAMNKIVKLTLKQAVPDATDEEIDRLPLSIFKQISEAISDVNGLN